MTCCVLNSDPRRGGVERPESGTGTEWGTAQALGGTA